MTAPDLSPAFYDAWTAMARRLGVDPIALARSSFAETGMYRRHPVNRRAGVWPFIESTLHNLGWQGTAEEFTALPPEDQLQYMERYLQPYAGRLRDDAMVYVVMFLPARLNGALAGDDSFVMTSRGDGTNFYEWNPVLDRNGDGVITVGDLRTWMDTQDRGARWATIEGELRARGATGGPGRPSAAIIPGRGSFLPLALAVGLAGAWYLYGTDDGVALRRRAGRTASRTLARYGVAL